MIGVIALAGYEGYKYFGNKESIKDSPINKVFNNKNSKEPKEKVPEEYKISLLATGDGLIHSVIYRSYDKGNGVYDFTDALKLVSLRGELMENAYPTGYGLSAISGLIEKDVSMLVGSVNRPENPVYLANYNAADQFVIAGTESAMQEVLDKAREKGATKTDRLAVAVPSHCPLLADSAQKLFDAMQHVHFKRPAIAYLSGSTGRVFWQADRIADDLAFNMARPLYWANAMTAAYERGVRLAVEMPPGSVLTGLAKRVMTDGDAVSIQQEGIHTVLKLGERLKGE